MTDWQPIDSAPKDGTHVLLFVTFSKGSPDQITARWWHDDWHLIQTGSHAEDSAVYGIPTHWKPLGLGPNGEVCQPEPEPPELYGPPLPPSMVQRMFIQQMVATNAFLRQMHNSPEVGGTETIRVRLPVDYKVSKK